MKIKSMIAAFAASAIAVSAMAVPASAADGDPVWYGGKIGVNSSTTGWKEYTQWAVNDDKIGDGKIEATKTDDGKYTVKYENPFADGINDDETYVQAWIQNYGPDDFKLVSVYFEGIDYNYPMDKMVAGDGNNTAYLVGGTEADPAIGEKTIDDAKNVTAIVWTFELPQAAGTPAETTTAPATTAADGTTAAGTTTKATTAKSGGTNTTSTKTGDAGVGVVVAAMSLAGAAAFVARKKH